MSLTRSCLLAASGLFVLATGMGPVAAADDGYDNVVSSLLSAVGVLKPDYSPEIEYRERAPLVLPPKMDLTTPVATGVGRPASWPQDPDVLKRRKAADEARAPILDNKLGNRKDLMSKADLIKSRSNGPDSEARSPYCGSKGNARGCLVVSPEELKAQDARYAAMGGGSDKKGDLLPGQEPDRMYLTQPPKGYLKVSKVVKAKVEAPKPVIDNANPASQLVYRPKPDDE